MDQGPWYSRLYSMINIIGKGVITTMNRPIGTMSGEAQRRSNPRNFLSLPPELRHVIYRHLLIPSPIVKMKRKAYDLEPAILLVNKKLYQEALWVLYRENDWILLHVKAPFQTYLDGWHLENDFQRYPIVPLAEKSFSQKPCLEVEICETGAQVRGRAGGDPRRFLVSLDGLTKVCQILTAAKNTSSLEIILSFVEVKADTLNQIMDCLEEVCGYGNVVAKGLDAEATQKAINKVMMAEASTGKETLERTTKYEAGITEHIAHGRYIPAMKACQDGMAYIDFVYNNLGNGDLNPHSSLVPTLLKFTNFALKHARCCLACEDFQSAREIMNLLLGSDPHTSLYQPSRPYVSEAHFYYGQSMVAGGAENAAAFSFFRALDVVPSHEGANAELDAMEVRLALRGPDAETQRVRQNLQTLGAWRHRNEQDGRLPHAERTKRISEFLLSDDERIPFEKRLKAIIDRNGLELIIDTLDSVPSRDSAFIFCVGVRVLGDDIL